MARYSIRFHGCPIGRLNTAVKDFVTREVEAGTEYHARLKAYETHEHIPGGADGVVAVKLGDEPADRGEA